MVFNFAKAWYRLAGPAFLALPNEIHQLCLAVIEEANHIKLRNDLSLPWPDSDLKERFNGINSELLAKSARIAWAAGHWHPGANNWLRPWMRTGAYWRFSSYADQILKSRVSLPSKGNPIFFEIHEGFLRAIVDYGNHWYWKEIGLATSEVCNKAIDIAPGASEKYEELDKLVKCSIDEMVNLRPTEKPIFKFFR